jgi:hypothetical protein
MRAARHTSLLTIVLVAIKIRVTLTQPTTASNTQLNPTRRTAPKLVVTTILAVEVVTEMTVLKRTVLTAASMSAALIRARIGRTDGVSVVHEDGCQ